MTAVRLRPGDLAALASLGLRTRKLRAGLSALGIAIGVAAIVAVLGLAASSQAALLAEITRLGTNLLTVTDGQSLAGATAELPQAAPGMIARLPGVAAVQDTGTVGGVDAYKSPYIPAIQTNALSVDAATLNLPAVAGTSLAQGRFLNAATAREPVTVLGALLGPQADPESPGQVNVSQPSTALTARADAAGALDALFLGLGAVALLVGAIGVANIMVISVLERRSEIGLRRALGATRGQIAPSSWPRPFCCP